MNRRSFFGVATLGVAAGAYSVALGLEALSLKNGRRVSIVKGDPGERLYGELRADGHRVEVLLDGVRQKPITADMDRGFVDRPIRTAQGNIAFNDVTGEILTERVYGMVEIVIT